MKTIEEIRLGNLLTLIDEYGTQRALGDALDRAPSQISQWATRAPSSETGTPRSISSEIARYIEQKLNRERGWMDHDHSPTQQGSPLADDELRLVEHWRTLNAAARKRISPPPASAGKPGGKKKSA